MISMRDTNRQDSPPEVQAKLFRTDRQTLDNLYPSYLNLKQLIIVHRHGERTPLAPRFLEFLPLNWNFCSLGNRKSSILPSITNKKSINEDVGFTAFPHLRVAEGKTTCKDDYSEYPIPSSIVNATTCLYGQLTDIGRLTLFRNGQHLRQIYVDHLNFLPTTINKLSPEELYFRTTDYSRTIESFQHLLVGLFPIENDSESPNIIIRSRDHRDENLYFDFKCRRLLELRRHLSALSKPIITEAWLNLREDLIASTALNKILSSSEFENPGAIHKLSDSLMCAQAHNLNIPKGITSYHLNQLEELHVKFWFEIFKNSPELLRLGIGRLFSDIANHLKSSVANPIAVKLAVYSAHDTTIGPLLMGMDVFDHRWPPFGAMIGFELFHDPSTPESEAIINPSNSSLVDSYKKYYVRVRHNDAFKVIPYCKKTGRYHTQAGPSFCRLDSFLDLMRQLSPAHFEKECNGFEDEVSVV